MADLPPIPDGAADAADTAMRGRRVGEDADARRATLAAGIAAAWPHLYAAALRHAAEHGGMRFSDGSPAAWLRRLADEADPPPEVEGSGD